MKRHLSRTMLNIMIYIGVTLAVTILTISGVLYTFTEREGLALIQQSDAELLDEASFHLSYVNQVGTAFCQTQFDDSDVQALMTEVYTPNPIFAVQIVNRMYKLLLTNEMAESIMVYNGRTGAAYSTLPIKNREYSELLALLQNDTSGEALSVRPRQVYNDVKKAYDHRVLTYILAERDYATNQILSAVVANVSTEWMLANLSDVQADKNNRMVLMSQDGTILLDSARSLPGINEKLDDALYKKIQSTDKSFYWQIDGKRQVVSSRMVNGSDWRLVVIQPYAAMGAFVGKIRTQVMLMVLFSLLLSVPLTLGIAQLIYRPFGTLFAHVARAGNVPVDPPQNAHAEVEYLRGVFDRQNDRLQQLENYKWNREEQQRKEKIRAILLDNGTHVLPPLGGEEDDRFKEGGEILLALLTVCGFENAAKDDKEKNIIRYAVANIAEELMQPYGTAEVVALTGGRLALLASPKEAVNDALARQCLMEISESAASVLGLSISAVYLQTRCENAILSRSYRELLTHTHYTLLYGSRFVLSEEELCTQDARSPVYPTELEAAILEALSAASAEAAAGKLRLFLQAIREDSAQGYFNCVIQLAMALQSYVQKVNEHKLVKVQADFTPILQALRAAETEDQVRTILVSTLQGIAEQMPYNAQRKNDAVIDTIRGYIDEHYGEKSLCGKMLAARVDISTGYLNMLFKDAMGSGVQEYINSVRLDHAQQLALGTNQQISQIIEACGLETSSFYRLYRARFGTSPKEQRARQKLTAEKE